MTEAPLATEVEIIDDETVFMDQEGPEALIVEPIKET